MLGSRVTAHLWQVTFSTNIQPDTIERLILTGDPTGSDLYDRVREVLEDNSPGSSSGLRLHLCRGNHEIVKGRAIVRTDPLS